MAPCPVAVCLCSSMCFCVHLFDEISHSGDKKEKENSGENSRMKTDETPHTEAGSLQQMQNSERSLKASPFFNSISWSKGRINHIC